MLAKKVVYILSFCLTIVLFNGCDGTIEPEIQDDMEVVYLTITRAYAAGQETFNDDEVDFEDRVHDLAMLVFDSSTGEKVCEYFDANISFSEKRKTFTVKLIPGQRDFYFVANMPMAELQTIADKTAMEGYMSRLNGFDTSFYLQATREKGFPMSRVYLNQQITKGGTIYQPEPFSPDGEERVRLIRIVAKLEIILTGNPETVDYITYHNAYTQFQFKMPEIDTPTNGFHSGNLSFTSPITTPVSDTLIYYMPEAVMSAVAWDSLSTTANRPINYFTIHTFNNKIYEVPIVVNGTAAQTNYVSFAKGQEPANATSPNYSIVRNNLYRYTINMPIEDYYIAVHAEVLPWLRRSQKIEF